MTLEPEEIEELAEAPERVTGDEGTVKERAMKDILEGQRAAASQRSSGGPPYGMRKAKVRYPGTP